MIYIWIYGFNVGCELWMLNELPGLYAYGSYGLRGFYLLCRYMVYMGHVGHMMDTPTVWSFGLLQLSCPWCTAQQVGNHPGVPESGSHSGE